MFHRLARCHGYLKRILLVDEQVDHGDHLRLGLKSNKAFPCDSRWLVSGQALRERVVEVTDERLVDAQIVQFAVAQTFVDDGHVLFVLIEPVPKFDAIDQVAHNGL